MRLVVSSDAMVIPEGAGWSENRREDVEDVEQALAGAGYELDENKLEALASLRGISVRLPTPQTMYAHFLNEDPFIVDPLGVGLRNITEARDLEGRLGFEFCPLGWWLCRSHVYFSTEGLTVAVLPGVIWRLGDTLDEAIEFMLLANAPLDRIESSDGL